MKVWSLVRNQDQGFSVITEDCGLWASKKLANARAKQLEPNDEVRKYEFSVSAKIIHTTLPQRLK